MDLKTVLEIESKVGGMAHYTTVAIPADQLFELCEVARKALSAAPEALRIHEGWKLVPLEPTDEMMFVGMEKINDGPQDGFGDGPIIYPLMFWKAALAVAPSVPSTQVLPMTPWHCEKCGLLCPRLCLHSLCPTKETTPSPLRRIPEIDMTVASGPKSCMRCGFTRSQYQETGCCQIMCPFAMLSQPQSHEGEKP